MKQTSLSRKTFKLLFNLCKNKLLEVWESIVWSNAVILYIQNVCISNVTSCTGVGDMHTYAWHVLDFLSGDSPYLFNKILLSSDRTFGSIQLDAAWGQALKFIVTASDGVLSGKIFFQFKNLNFLWVLHFLPNFLAFSF